MAFAKTLATNQASLNRWEKNIRPIPVAVLIRLADLAPPHERAFWMKHAGIDHAQFEDVVQRYKVVYSISEEINRTIFVYGNAGPGVPLWRPEDATDKVSLPIAWLGNAGHLVGLVAVTDSMAPRIVPGDIVIVDSDDKDPSRLVDKIIAVTIEKAVTLKWLRKHETGYLLVPHNMSAGHAVLPWKRGRHEIVGPVVRWIGGGDA